MIPMPVYIGVGVVATIGLAIWLVDELRQIRRLDDPVKIRKRRNYARRALGLMGLVWALFPVVYGKGWFTPRATIFEYVDLAIGLTGLGMLVATVILFSDPEPIAAVEPDADTTAEAQASPQPLTQDDE